MSAAVRWSHRRRRRGSTPALLILSAALALAAGLHGHADGRVIIDLPTVVQVRWADPEGQGFVNTTGSIVSACGHVLTWLHDAGMDHDSPPSIEIWAQPNPFEAMRHLYDAELHRVDLALELAVLRIVTVAHTAHEPLLDRCSLSHLTIASNALEHGDPLTVVGYATNVVAGAITLRRWVAGFAGDFELATLEATADLPAGNAWIVYEEPWSGQRLLGLAGAAMLDEHGALVAILLLHGDGLGLARPARSAIELLRDLPGVTMPVDQRP